MMNLGPQDFPLIWTPEGSVLSAARGSLFFAGPFAIDIVNRLNRDWHREMEIGAQQGNVVIRLNEAPDGTIFISP